MLNNDIELEVQDTEWESNEDISFDVTDLMEEANPDDKDETIPEVDKPADVVDELIPDTIPEPEVTPEDKPEEKPDDIEDVLDDLLAELDNSNEAIDKIEESWAGTTEVALLKDSFKKMEDQIKKLNNDKTDLTLRNAELETFGSDSTDPKILILSKHLDKARTGDDRSKSKVSTIIKEMLYELTWEDYDKDQMNSNIDTLSASEAYNNKSNPKLNIEEKDEEFGLSM